MKPAFAPPLPLVRSGLLQRKCACGGSPAGEGECEECRRKALTLQRRPVNGMESSAVPPIVHEVLDSPGQPLEPATRTLMEGRFGHDFGHVRVHVDARAAESARAVNALAYTVGGSVVFAAEQYSPNTLPGQRLIAHELTHTLQQGAGGERPHAALRMTDPEDSSEKEAEDFANEILNEELAARGASPGAEPLALARQEGAATPVAGGAEAAAQCTPAPGFPPAGNCTAYVANSWWLPLAYVNNATCACTSTPDVPTANCVRKFLQDRLAATPTWLKALAAAQKPLELNPATFPSYQAFVQTTLTPRIYQDHVDAYRSCCCPSGPAPYPEWIGVTLVPFQPCALVGWFIEHFGSCTGTSGAW